MRICLIRCPSPFLIDDRVFPPLGLMAVGTYLQEIGGHYVTIHDGGMTDIPLDFEYYGFGPTTPEYPYALEMKNFIKLYNPEAKIIIGGPHATIIPEDCRKDGFDNVFTGVVDYPMIDRTLVDIKSYKYFINGELATTAVTSVGCPYHCAFCCKVSSDFSMREADEVIKEIEDIHFMYGYKAIMFFDDIFILDKKRTEKICKCLKELGIIWRCFLRADLIVKHGKEFVRMMADSGCKEVGMGVESGSNKILEIINKGETIETIKTAIRMLKDEGIRVKGFFILGLPGESKDTLKETERLLEEIKFDDLDIRIYQPYPGTLIWKNRDFYDIKWDFLELEKSFYKGRTGEYYGNISTSFLSNKQLVESWNHLEGEYKCQPRT